MNTGSLQTAAALAVGLSLALSQVAFAQHDHGHGDLVLHSTADGSGNLSVEYPIDERPVLRVSADALPGVFSSTSPGAVPGTDEPLESLYELNVPTEVRVELVARRGDVTLDVGGTLLDTLGELGTLGLHSCQIDVDHICVGGSNPGAACPMGTECMGGTCELCEPELSTLHDHPIYFINLATPDHNTFGEGEVTIRFVEGSTGQGYGASETITFEVSNGYLPALAEDPNDPDATAAADKCRKAVAKGVRTVQSKHHKLLAKCLDAVFAAEALGKSIEKAAAACGEELRAAVQEVTDKAVAKIDGTCDATPSSFGPFTGSNVRTHLGMAACRTQELAGAGYNGSFDEIVEVLSTCDPVKLTCLAGPNAGSACNPGLCDGGTNDGNTCVDDAECSGGECDPQDDCDSATVEDEVREAFPCLRMSQSEE